MNPDEKRDFREETALNAAEWQLLKVCASKLGLTKSATLRFALHQLGDKITRDEARRDTGRHTDD